MLLLKQFLFFLILIIVHEKSFGQKLYSHIGMKGGLNFSNLSGSNHYNKRSGADFKIFLETNISKTITFESIGLEFSSQGAKKNGFQAFTPTDKYVQYFPVGQLPKYLYADISKEKKLNYLFQNTIFRVHTNAEKKLLSSPL